MALINNAHIWSVVENSVSIGDWDGTPHAKILHSWAQINTPAAMPGAMRQKVFLSN